MASPTDWKTPGTCATVDRDGKTAWSNPDNAKTSNNVYTTVIAAKNDYSDWLRVTNFGFAVGDIPAGATIDGIEVKVERKSSMPDVNIDNAIYLRKTSGQVGDNKSSGGTWPESDTEKTYGGAADTWNAGLVDTDIKSSDFGLDLSVGDIMNGGTTASVDVISIRVYYTEAVTFKPWAIIM